jgi:hemerythrin-like domain-containing protein
VPLKTVTLGVEVTVEKVDITTSDQIVAVCRRGRERQNNFCFARKRNEPRGEKMQARGLLMIEHRLIERMLAVIRQRLVAIKASNAVDPVFIDTTVDFIRTYADRTHHGKEEDILFRDLNARNLSDADRRVMNELVEEHVFGRNTTKELVDANTRYRNGDASALGVITVKLETLVDFYPRHIEKEDKVFFPAARTYFSVEEDQALLAEFWEFDRKMIHEKYKAVVATLEGV